MLPPNPWSPSPPRGTFTRRPLAQPPCTLHILILINVMQVSPFWGLPSFSIPNFLLDLHNHMSFIPWFPASVSRESVVFYGGRITPSHLDLSKGPFTQITITITTLPGRPKKRSCCLNLNRQMLNWIIIAVIIF